MRRTPALAGVGTLLIVSLLMSSDATRPQSASSDGAQNDDQPASDADRADALARAHVWRAPASPIARAALKPDISPRLDCHFQLSDLGGTTPKFRCALDDGSEVRVKYGFGSEIPAEAAATRLLAVLGFGADRVTLVERLRCYGCPREPFVTTQIVQTTRTEGVYQHVLDPEKYEEFEWVVVEGKFDGCAIETDQQEGWAFFELDHVEPSKGGAPREHVDALRLMAVFLAHWDNKSDNQRLVCLSTRVTIFANRSSGGAKL